MKCFAVRPLTESAGTMTAIFISHRCADSASAEKLEKWLVEQGHERHLLDFDWKHGIPAGADWAQSLHQESRRRQAILVFLTPDWLTSKWRWAELAIIREKRHAVFVVRLKPCVSGPIIPTSWPRLIHEGDLGSGLGHA
jgi:hypothetical protein